ncbi:MAG: hypothetical protein PHS48_00900 [Bacteroidales bacterium]|nr:hypothetical protein [Bacteroidales bacterium]
MRKKLLTASGLLLTAALYIGINSYQNVNSLGNLFLANVEALTINEHSGKACYADVVDHGGYPESLVCDISGCDYKNVYIINREDIWICP